MKNISFIFLSVSILLATSCKKGDDSSDCGEPGFYVSNGTSGNNNSSSSSSYLSFSGGSGSYGFYEIEYGSNGFTKGTGTILTVSGSQSLNGLAAGTYDLYARGNCGGTNWSEWGGPKSFLVQQGAPTCATPTALSASSVLWLNWEHSPYADAEKYELEYGVTGFSLGSGTRETINGYFGTYSDGVFAQGTTYDFYVRAYCGNNDWSEWSSVHTFYASVNRNRCLVPTQVNAYSKYNYFGDCVGAEFQWDQNGEDQWEVSLVSQGSSPGSGNIELVQSTGITYAPIACWGYYDFYIRTVCQNGTRTAWHGPTEF